MADASLNAAKATFSNSSNYSSPGTWVTSPWAITGEPSVTSLAADEAVTAAYAEQWNLAHQTDNIGSTVAIPLRKVLFVRGGTMWSNAIQIDLGANSYNDFQLSFRDNAGTRGDLAGTIPVLAWADTFTGVVTLAVTLKGLGRVIIGLRARHVASGDYSMFEMEWNIVR